MPAVKPTAQPWERRDSESTPAFVAFATYRDLGSARSIDAAWRGAKQQQGGNKRAPGSWTKWATDHDWVSRAAAYDDHLERIELAARQKVVKAQTEADARRRMQNARATQGAGFKLIEKAQLEEITALEARKLLKEAAKLIEVGAKNELLELARAEAADRAAEKAKSSTGEAVTDEEELMRRMAVSGMGAMPEARYG